MLSKLFKAAIYLAALLGLNGQTIGQNLNYIPGRIVVQYEDASMGASKSLPGQNPAQELLHIVGAGQSRSYISRATESKIIEQLGARKATVQGGKILDELRRTFVYDYIGDMDAALLAAKLSNMPGVVYAEPWFLYEQTYIPNDEYVGQSGHDYFGPQGFHEAWDITKGSSDIIIAIVDSGIDYTHPDLLAKSWVNQDEIPTALKGTLDVNQDGRVSSLEIHNWIVASNNDHNGDGIVNLRDAIHASSPLTNGQDSDGNGHIDDILGTDFWDNGYAFGSVFGDNDPYAEFNMHGTHVGGLAAASTDNTLGVAGTGFNSLYMAVKVGGVRDLPETELNESALIGFGYEGILYAALNGARVVNCSWSGTNFSAAGQNTIRMAKALGTVVVASAGNRGTFINEYPSAFREVLSVGSTDYVGVPIGTKSGFSTYNYYVDVMATGRRNATLGGVWSTWRGLSGTPPYPNGEYSFAAVSGTSMSTPIVAGLAALVADEHPDWSSERITTQIRVTSTMADHLNDNAMRGALGRGYINAHAALTRDLPGYTVVSTSVVNAAGGKATVTEDAFVRYRVVNHGAAKPAVAILSTEYFGISILSNNIAISASTDDTITVDFPIRINFVTSAVPIFKVEFENTTDNYYDFNIFQYTNIFWEYKSSDNFRTSLNSFINVGSINRFNNQAVTGFIVNTDKPQNQQYNILFEGGLMVHSKNRVADRIRDTGSNLSTGALPRSPFVLQRSNSQTDWNQYGTGMARLRLRDAANATPLDTSLSVKIESYVFNRPEINRALFVKYTVRNDSETMADSTIIGLFNDIDIANSNNNSVMYSEADSLQYVYAPANAGSPFVAVVPVGSVYTMFAINKKSTGGGLDFGVDDGFTTQEKITALKAGRAAVTANNVDASTVVASGPYHIPPTGKVEVGFIYVYGNTLEELRAQVAAARAIDWINVTPPGMVTSNAESQPDVPYATGISGNFPNPFNPTTTLVYELANSGNIDLAIYNTLGQRVAMLYNGFMSAGRHQTMFDASRLGSGVYFVRMAADNRVFTHKMTLIK